MRPISLFDRSLKITPFLLGKKGLLMRTIAAGSETLTPQEKFKRPVPDGILQFVSTVYRKILWLAPLSFQLDSWQFHLSSLHLYNRFSSGRPKFGQTESWCAHNSLPLHINGINVWILDGNFRFVEYYKTDMGLCMRSERTAFGVPILLSNMRKLRCILENHGPGSGRAPEGSWLCK